MIIDKVPAYKQQKQIKLALDRLHYDILCRYILQPITMVRMEQLTNVSYLMSIIDPSTYENDPEKTKRVRFIMKGLEAKLKEGIQDTELVLSYINGGLDFKIDFLNYDNLLLNTHEIEYVNSFVQETLNYKFIYERVDNLQDILTRFKTADFNSKGPIVSEVRDAIDELKTEFRKNESNNNISEMEFSLEPGVFDNTVKNVWGLARNPSRRLITGMQALNEMLGGGFESGRAYLLMGASGVGKSLTLLNLIYQMKIFNTNIKTRDPSKKPCICLLTMENSVVETVTRLFDLIIGNNANSGMENYDINEVLRILRQDGQLMLNESSPINIYIKYKPTRSVNTSYLYTLYDDLLDRGYEMICLVQDHVKRIRSVYANADLRIELGDTINEMKAFATEKDIPVITNTHLNREATRLIEDAMNKKSRDVGRQLGKSYAGESLLMVDNIDVAISIALDFDKDNNRYITFNLSKMRDKNKNGRQYFAQPFMPGSTIRLMEDLGGIPQYKDSLHTSPDLEVNTIVKTTGASSLTNEIADLLSKNVENDENAFAKKTYTMSEETEVKEKVVHNPLVFFKDTRVTDIISDINKKKEVHCPLEFFDVAI